MDGTVIARELETVLAELGAAAAEIVTIYFEHHQTRERNIKWIERQLGRELSAGHRFFQEAGEMSARIDSKAQRTAFLKKLRSALEEFEHYDALADVLESCLDTHAKPEALLKFGVWSDSPELPENKKKVEFEKHLAETGGPLAVLSIEMSEGCGLGAFYAMANVKGGELEERLATVNRKILRDEAGHGPVHISRAAQIVKTPEELKTVKKMLRERGKYYLRMKNEQFDFPVSEARLTELERGAVNSGLVRELREILFGEKT